MTNFRVLAGGIAVVAGFMLQACYTAPAPTPVPTRSIGERFEQSWQAARGAAADVGVRITFEDKASANARPARRPSAESTTNPTK